MKKEELEKLVEEQKAKIEELEKLNKKMHKNNKNLVYQKSKLCMKITLVLKTAKRACEIINEKVDPSKTPEQILDMLNMASAFEVKTEHPEWAYLIK